MEAMADCLQQMSCSGVLRVGVNSEKSSECGREQDDHLTAGLRLAELPVNARGFILAQTGNSAGLACMYKYC